MEKFRLSDTSYLTARVTYRDETLPHQIVVTCKGSNLFVSCNCLRDEHKVMSTSVDDHWRQYGALPHVGIWPEEVAV